MSETWDASGSRRRSESRFVSRSRKRPTWNMGDYTSSLASLSMAASFSQRGQNLLPRRHQPRPRAIRGWSHPHHYRDHARPTRTVTPATTWLEDEMESVALAFGLRGVDIKGGQEDGARLGPIPGVGISKSRLFCHFLEGRLRNRLLFEGISMQGFLSGPLN